MAKLDTLKSARGLQTADIEMHFLLDSEEGTNEVLGPGNEHRYRWFSDDVTTGTEMARLELVGGTVELFVYGALNVSGITTFNTVPYTWPGADAAGQLQSDGAGNLSWAAGTTEVNDLSAVVTWANVPDANITESSVTQHEAALAIAFSQVTGTVPATQGGTGQTVYTVGDILYASTTTALTPLIAGTATHVLTSNGAGVAPSWQAVGGGTPGGSTTEIQYNLAGAFAGSSTFTLDGSGYLNVPRIIRGGSGHTKAGTYNANATIFDGGNSGATSLGGPATQTGWMMRLWGSGNFGTSSSGFGIENTAFWVNTSGTSFNTYVTGTLAMQVDAARTYIRDSVSAFSGRALAIYRQDLSAWATLSSGTGATTIGVDTNFQDNIGLIFGASGADAEMKWSGTSANDALHFGVNVSGLAASSANLNIVNQVYIDNDFDRPIATDPTVNIFSATDPDTNNTQYLSLTHNQTDGVIEVGTGAVSIAPATGSVKYRGIPYTWPASDSTGSQALQSNGSGVLSWVSVPNGADYLNKDGSVALTADWDAGSFDIRAATLTADGLTSGRVVYASTNGLLTDDSGFTYAVGSNSVALTGYMNLGTTTAASVAGAFSAGSTTEYLHYDPTNVILTMLATNPGNNGPRIDFHHNRASPAAFDKVTEFLFHGEDSASNKEQYGGLRCEAFVLTSTSEQGQVVISANRNGSQEDSVHHAATEAVFNSNGLDRDFRVAGDTLTHLLYCEGAAATENIALLQDAAPNWRTGDRILNIGEATTEPTAAPAAGEGSFLWYNGTTDDLKARSVGQNAYSITRGITKKWVKFNGTGTIAINDDLGVASLTDNGNGDYTVNYDSGNMADTDYCANVSGNGVGSGLWTDLHTLAAASVRVVCRGTTSNTDTSVMCVAVQGDLA